MRITTVRVATAKTINLGNFQSLRIEADVTAEIAEGEDIAAIKPRLQSELKALLDETYRAQRKEPEPPKPFKIELSPIEGEF